MTTYLISEPWKGCNVPNFQKCCSSTSLRSCLKNLWF